MNHGLSIAYMLLVADRELTTKEIIKRVGCDRKTVYKTIDEMELAGFITTKINHGNGKECSYSCSLCVKNGPK